MTMIEDADLHTDAREAVATLLKARHPELPPWLSVHSLTMVSQENARHRLLLAQRTAEEQE